MRTRTTLISTLIMSCISFIIISCVYLYQEHDINVLSYFTISSMGIFEHESEQIADDLIASEHSLELITSIIERPHYVIKAQLNAQKSSISGSMTIKMKKPAGDVLVFNNYSPGNMNNMTIHEVQINDIYTKYTFTNNQLQIKLNDYDSNRSNESNNAYDSNSANDDLLKINISFNTRIPQTGTRFGVKDNVWLLTTWYPILNVQDADNQWYERTNPVGYGDPFYFEHADYDVYLLAPNNIDWVTSGTLVSEEPSDNLNTYHWQESTIRNFALVGSKHYTIHDFPTDDGTTIQIALTSTQYLDQIKEILEYCYPLYKDIFGPLPYKTIAIAETSWNTNFALEYPNIAIYSKDLYSQGLLERWLAHEFAHIWWYNAVGNHEVSDGWIDEGLVEHATVLYLENRYGRDRSLELQNFFHNKNIELINKNSNMLMDNTLNNFLNRDQFFASWYYRSADMFLTLREELGIIKYSYFLKSLFEQNFGTIIGIEQLNESLQQTIKGNHQYFDDWVYKPLQDTPFSLEATPLPIKINGQHIDNKDIHYIDWEVYIPYQLLQEILFSRLENPLTIDSSNGQLYYNNNLIFSLPAKNINDEWLVPVELLSHISENQFIWDYQRNLLTINVYYFK